MKTDALIGLSVNPEVELAIENTPGPKKSLKSTKSCLSGSSGNVATAIKKLGGKPHLLGLTTANKKTTLADLLLKEAVQEAELPFTQIRALIETNICFIPTIGTDNGVSWGKRNDLDPDAVEKALQNFKRLDIYREPGRFSVVTGLRAPEVVFAETLLEWAEHGFRVLNANHTLCSNKLGITEILRLVDLLVINRLEFQCTGMSINELHAFGPRIIVVTHDKDGGMFSLASGQTGTFNPVSFPGGKFETGAGDWFLGGMISELIRLKETVCTITPNNFQQVINFAARVAGKKITIPGGGNGPTRSEL